MIEQLYNDFTTKLLPTIQEGLVISKEYFTDLFGRYVEYLIISDIIWLTTSFLALCLSGFILLRFLRQEDDKRYTDFLGKRNWGILLSCFVTMVCLFSVIARIDNLYLGIYVPELRVYKEIQNYRKLSELKR